MALITHDALRQMAERLVPRIAAKPPVQDEEAIVVQKKLQDAARDSLRRIREGR